MLQGEPGSVVSGGGIPGRKGEPGIPGSPVRSKLESGLLFESVDMNNPEFAFQGVLH